ncbi:MAG: SpoIIE family protein phosphatase [Verrucomicrobiota bacterium]|jgi:phosphoserine phosphatase RsbU/P
MNKPIRVLIVEDSEDDTLLLLHELRRAGYDPIYRRVETAGDMVAALEHEPWDIVTADHTMPHFNSTEALQILQKWNRDIPFIVVSGTIGEDAAVAAMKAGAQDYLIKGNLARFVPAVEREIVDAGHRRRQRELEWKLLAQHEQLHIAREIQQRLFPPSELRLENFEIAGMSIPADETGGDYFDYIPMPEKHHGVVIGDITGHGLGAALLMAEVHVCFRTLAEHCIDASEIFQRANQLTKEDFGNYRFLTVLFACLHPPTRSLVYLNAGHPTGYVLNRDGTVRVELKSSDMPLGVHPLANFAPTRSVQLKTDDVVVLLTDGVLSAFVTPDDPTGDRQALSIVRRHRDQSAIQIVEELCGSAHAADTSSVEEQDDITAVVLKVKAAA